MNGETVLCSGIKVDQFTSFPGDFAWKGLSYYADIIFRSCKRSFVKILNIRGSLVLFYFLMLCIFRVQKPCVNLDVTVHELGNSIIFTVIYM